jgi:L-asparaginase/Glu-tRNA(Gln) amidotransferase subunit D
MFGAEELNAQKARVLLMLALARSSDPREIVTSFRRY